MIAVQYLLFIFIVLLFAVAYPLSGYHQQKLFKINESGKLTKKIRWYYNTILWGWIPVIAVIVVIWLSGFRFRNIGLKQINLSESGFDNWIIYLLTGLYIVYLCYNIYSLFALRINPDIRRRSLNQVPVRLRPMLPVTSGERKVWVLVCVTAGITEEILYRGYLFFALGLLFPFLPLWSVLLISSALFATGHIYQGKSAIRPAVAGFFFGLFYILFDSIIPVIIAHILQDIVVIWLMTDNE